jgi:hypothetical protein
MITIKLKDELAAHEPSFFNTKNQNKIKISRDDIEEGDIVIYTNQNFKHIDSRALKNIAFICESYDYHKRYYDWIKLNHEKFDLVLTWNKELLELNPNKFKLQLFGTTWMNEKYRKIYEKNKLCSIIASNKKVTSGHKLRHIIIDYLIQNNINTIDFYGGRFNNLPYMNTNGHTEEHSGQHESNQKINALKDYRFTICILSSKSDYEFDEKLIDCFLTGTVPIFWGCPSIHKFFNVKGMLIFNTLQECINIINTLTIEKYTGMLPYIKENFKTAKKYSRFKFNEDVIIECINNQ